ncbi:MAG: putative polysaccharide biosynthesis protein [Cellulosilyticaceae bacterium]
MKKDIEGQAVIKGAMILAGAVFISRIIGLVYKIPITNQLGDEGMSIYLGAYSVYALLLTFSAIGIPGAISKLVSERIAVGKHNEAHRVFKIAMIYTSAVGIISSMILWFGAEAISVLLKGDTTLTMPLRALAPTLIIVSIMAILRGYFQGLGNMIPSATSQVIEQLFNAVCSVTFTYLLIPKGIIVAATGGTLGPGIGATASLIFLTTIYFTSYKQRKRLRAEEIIDENNQYKEPTSSILKQVLFLVVPILLTSSIFSITTTIDQKMLYEKLPESIAYLESNDELELLPITSLPYTENKNVDLKATTDRLVGQYMSKYVTLINLPVSLILQLATAAMPAIAAAMMLKNYKDLRKKIAIVLKTGMIFAAPAALGLLVFGEQIVPILFKSAPDGGRLIVYGAIGIIPMGLAQLSGGMLQGMGYQKVPVKNALIACILKVILNGIFLMIPYFHIYSVVISTMLCYCLYAYLNLRELCKIVEFNFDWMHLIGKPLIAAVGMGISAYGIFIALNYIKVIPFVWLMVSIVLAIGIYGVLLISIGGLTQNELSSMPGGKYLKRLVR